MKRIYVVGTADTKGEELAFLADAIAATGSRCSARRHRNARRHRAGRCAGQRVAAHHPDGAGSVLGIDDRGTAVAGMSAAFTSFIQSRDDISGVIGIGGGGGTSIITSGMRALPLGLPKIMVSTLASGDTAPYVDVSDIIMMPSVTDMAGLNRLSRVVLAQCGAGHRRHGREAGPAATGKPALGLTMFGVTTPCVTAIADQLRANYDCMVFHATGTGGRSMEKLADSGLLAGVIDITTTEVCDLLFGGVLPATEDRFGAIARTKLPYVGSVGALDMVNFWAPPTIPEKYRGRLFYEHNPNITLMRTTAEECRSIGEWIGEQAEPLRRSGAFPDPGKRRLGARHRGRRLLRSGGRRRPVRCHRAHDQAERHAPRDAAAAAHQRSRNLPRPQRRPSSTSPDSEIQTWPPYRARTY